MRAESGKKSRILLRIQLLADMATNYVQYRIAQQRIRIARDNLKIQEGVLALADQRFKVGTATNLDVQQAKTVLEQTRSTIPALEIVLGQANDTLCILLGFPPRDLEPELGHGPEAASAATQLGIQQYRAGTIDFNRVFSLETTQVQQQDQLAIARGSIALNLINVHRALGGGWELPGE